MWYDVFGWNGHDYTLLYDLIEGTAMARLILGLKIGNGDGCSLLDLDSVPGVDWNELADRNGFSELHKIVYGISSQPLDAEIEVRPEDLHKPDSIGLTALWYACWLGNSNHIRILIRHGADVNNARLPPICAAVWRGSYDSVEQLLNAGALIRGRSIDILHTTLMYRPSRPREHVEEVLAIDKALFGQFLNVNYRSSLYGLSTPLVALVWQRSSDLLPRMRQLLELGADIELCDEWGVTPLHHAIYVGNAEGCKILGRAGANANVRDHIGGTILHTAIKSATHPNVVQAVSELDLSEIELGAKDESGCTAFELFKIRAGEPRNDRNIFTMHLPPMIYGMPRWYFDEHFDEVNILDCSVENFDTELQILLSFQTLLQQIQEAQGIPIKDRYPLLSLTRECLTVDHNKDWSSKTIMPSVPGAWPDS